MARLTEDEPLPLPASRQVAPSWPGSDIVYRFSKPDPLPQKQFFEVLQARRSRTGGPIAIEQVGRILHFSMQLREQRSDGRFGFWESRTCASAGGIHGIRVCLVPISDEKPGGFYSPDDHTLSAMQNASTVRSEATRFLRDLKLPPSGWVVQLVADVAAYSDRYLNPESLILRDAGALCATISLVCEAFGERSRLLGHLDRGIVTALDLGANYAGVGGVHLTGSQF